MFTYDPETFQQSLAGFIGGLAASLFSPASRVASTLDLRVLCETCSQSETRGFIIYNNTIKDLKIVVIVQGCGSHDLVENRVRD